MKTPTNEGITPDSKNLQDYQDQISKFQVEGLFPPLRFGQSDREREASLKIRKLLNNF